MRPVVRLLPCKARLHLQHGPIDLVLGVDGPARGVAFRAAAQRFETVLDELVAELPLLRSPLAPGARPRGQIARRMAVAAQFFAADFITPMAAVAGAVADTVLEAMRDAAPFARGYVNNGGDIALHLAPGQRFTTAIQRHDGADIGRISIQAGQGIGGIATSGRHGRSLSMGIADSVTVLARDAARADAAATLIANAVDLPGHPAIRRAPAKNCDPDSDLGSRAVVTGCGALQSVEVAQALEAGLARASDMRRGGVIVAAALHLHGQTRTLGAPFTLPQRSLTHA